MILRNRSTSRSSSPFTKFIVSPCDEYVSPEMLVPVRWSSQVSKNSTFSVIEELKKKKTEQKTSTKYEQMFISWRQKETMNLTNHFDLTNDCVSALVRKIDKSMGIIPNHTISECWCRHNVLTLFISRRASRTTGKLSLFTLQDNVYGEISATVIILRYILDKRNINDEPRKWRSPPRAITRPPHLIFTEALVACLLHTGTRGVQTAV